LRKDWKKLVEIVSTFENTPVLVAGDLVLDRFWFGAVQRISREAPVPIVRLFKAFLAPGCAANSAANLASLGARPVVIGVVGKDSEGTQLIKLLEELGAETKYILRERSWVTPTKTRILAGTIHGPKQQLVRVDIGEDATYSRGVISGLEAVLAKAAQKVKASIISDYGYGLCENLDILSILGKKTPTAVDSRFAMSSFIGATTATPNEEEFERAIEKAAPADRKTFEKEAESLRKKLKLKALLVTRGSKGMALFQESKAPVHIPVAGKDEIVDVTGAGDTVIAAYVLSLARGAAYEEAANIANVAGGIAVQKPGTATVSKEELVKWIELWGKGKI
jgi:D-glycero-beta-D-manno-heptose-7-phosphate kinase